MFLWLFECSDTLKREICQVEKVFRYRSDIVRVVHGIYLSVPSHGTFPIGMTFPWTSLDIVQGGLTNIRCVFCFCLFIPLSSFIFDEAESIHLLRQRESKLPATSFEKSLTSF